MPDRAIRVLCADDNPMVAEALAANLRRDPGFVWLGVLPSAQGLTDAAVSLDADVVLIDVDMPGPDPFAAVRDLAALAPSARAVMISGHVIPELVDRALEAGSWGYISKHEGITHVINALRAVYAGEVTLPSDVDAAE